MTAKVKAAIQAGRDDLAGSFATQLEQVRSALARNQGQFATARAAFDKAMLVKKAFMRERNVRRRRPSTRFATIAVLNGRRKSPM